MDYRAELIAELRGLADGTIKPKYPRSGLCNHLSNMYAARTLDSALWHHVTDLMDQWPQGTGHHAYPVPPILGEPCTRESAELIYYTRKLLWGDNAYGRARKALCSWLADQVEKDISL
jgi:hypothetical protein